MIDFGVGDPREPTPAFIREALAAGIGEPLVLPARRRAARAARRRHGVVGRRYGVDVDPDREIVPTLGSKEAIFSFAQIAVGERRLVAVSEPGYPVYERGALFAGAGGRRRAAAGEDGLAAGPRRVRPLGRARPLLDVLPVRPDGRDGAARVPRGAIRPGARARVPRLLRRGLLGAVVRRGPPVSALQVSDRENVVVFNTLSKRSSMTGYRSGFVCAAPAICDALRAFRPTNGHGPARVRPARLGRRVVRTRRTSTRCARCTAASARALLPALEPAGLRLAGGDATFFLWCAVEGE